MWWGNYSQTIEHISGSILYTAIEGYRNILKLSYRTLAKSIKLF